MKTALIGIAGIAVAAIGCSSSKSGASSGLGSVTGTIAGSSMDVASALSASYDNGQGSTFGAVILSSTPGLCATLTGGHRPPNSQFLVLLLGDVNGSTIIEPGGVETETVWNSVGTPPAAFAEIFYNQLDSGCNPTNDVNGASGSINLTSTDGLTYWAGNGNVVTTAGNFSVSFAPVECQALQTLLSSNTPPPCL